MVSVVVGVDLVGLIVMMVFLKDSESQITASVRYSGGWGISSCVFGCKLTFSGNKFTISVR